jgi:hypothetical protein
MLMPHVYEPRNRSVTYERIHTNGTNRSVAGMREIERF